MLETINRNVLIIKPAKPLIEWVNYIFPEPPLVNLNGDKHDNSNVYLIPSMDCIGDSLVFLKENFDSFFQEELYGWCEDESLWPQKRDWIMFELWLDYSIQSMVIDTLPQAIKKEEF